MPFVLVEHRAVVVEALIESSQRLWPIVHSPSLVECRAPPLMRRQPRVGREVREDRHRSRSSRGGRHGEGGGASYSRHGRSGERHSSISSLPPLPALPPRVGHKRRVALFATKTTKPHAGRTQNSHGHTGGERKKKEKYSNGKRRLACTGLHEDNAWGAAIRAGQSRKEEGVRLCPCGGNTRLED